MSPRFVIVGTGRSGSGYISRVLTEAGIRTGHEGWWNTWDERDETLIGDSSCCALPMGLNDYDGQIYWQLRHPLDFIQSMVASVVVDPHLSLFQRLAPDADPADVLGFAMAMWVGHIEAAARYRPPWWRTDQITADLIVQIGGSAGISVSERDAQAAIDSVPTTYNQHRRSGPRRNRRPILFWSDLYAHDSLLASRIAEYVDGYGFPP